MDTSKFDSQVAELEQEIDSLKEEMENLRIPITDSYVTMFSSLFQESIPKILVSHPEKAQELGNETLGSLKKELNELIKELPKLCKKILENDKHWEHTYKLPIDWGKEEFPSDPFSGTAGKGLLEVRREVHGYLGAILQKYELINLNENHIPTWELEANRNPRYALGYSWHSNEETAVKDLITQYSELSKNYVDILRKKAEVLRKKNEFMATTMWDDA